MLSYLVEPLSDLEGGRVVADRGLDWEGGRTSQRRVATSPGSNPWRPSSCSRASRISSQGVSLLSPARDVSTTRVIFSTVGPRNRSTARSAAPRVRSLRGFSGVRSGEPAGCRTREEFPEADGVRLRVVRSTLQSATSGTRRRDNRVPSDRPRLVVTSQPKVKEGTCT